MRRRDAVIGDNLAGTMKDSTTDWIHEKIENLPIALIDGDRSEKYPKRSEFQKDGVVFLNAESISGGRLDLDKVNYISENKYLQITKGRLHHNDIILTMRGNGVGDSALFSIDSIKGIINAQMLIIRPDSNKIDSKFLYYELTNPAFKRMLMNFVSGSAQPQLTITHLKHVPLLVPPIADQKNIARILGSLDDKIELNRRMNATLETMAQALFKSWFVDFDPVIDNALAAGHPIPEALQERAEARATLGDQRQPLPEAIRQQFPNRFVCNEDMGWVPEGWISVVFEALADAKQGRYLEKSEMLDFPNSENQYPVWGGNGILGFSKEKIYDAPVTLMTCRGSNCGLIKTTQSAAWISNNSFACKSKFGSEYFLYLYFLNDDFSNCISGSAQPQITYTAVRNKRMKYPINKLICDIFSGIVADFRKKIFVNEDQNQELAKLRDTLLPKLLSGQLRIPEAEQQVADMP